MITIDVWIHGPAKCPEKTIAKGANVWIKRANPVQTIARMTIQDRNGKLTWVEMHRGRLIELIAAATEALQSIPADPCEGCGADANDASRLCPACTAKADAYLERGSES